MEKIFGLKRENGLMLLALGFATAVCCGLVGVRIMRTGNIRYGFLFWNLFLAWIPMLLALLALAHSRLAERPTVRLAFLSGAWLLFFPNAPYICTDLIHLQMKFSRQYWVDMPLILSCAVTALIVGFVSLFLMQRLVNRYFGRVLGWVFTLTVLALSGIGVYVGRFLRFNSWDALVRPVTVAQGIGELALSGNASHPSISFPLLFATFLLITYLMLYAMTHLRSTEP